jgi:hypothetical protein
MLRLRNVFLIVFLFVAGCGDDAAKPHIKFMSGGISFDPAHSHATLLLVVRQLKPLPEGGKLTADLTFPDARYNQKIEMAVNAGNLTYGFNTEFPADPTTSDAFRAEVRVVEADGNVVATIAEDFGGRIDKHVMPRNSDMIPNRERQVEQLNDEGF